MRPQKGPKWVDTNIAVVKSYWFFNNTCLENIHEFGHSNEWAPTMSVDGIISEHSLQLVLLHQASGKSHNYQTGFRLDQRASTYINTQETKPALVVNLTEDEVSTRRAWGVWVCLTEMDKVKYPFKIYQNSVNGSFLLNTMTGNITRFANDMFE
ncbi:hypothetical protein ACS0TY_008294 [Phlomoides rotata]